MRIMGIDYGDIRIGVAVSDLLGWTAQGIETIQWKDSLKKPLERIKQLVDEYSVEKIVVGFPKNMDGSIGFRGEKTLEFIKMLEKHVDVEVVKWDERLSTVAANRAMHEMEVKISRKKKVVDQIAAAYMLQGYLDSVSNKNNFKDL